MNDDELYSKISTLNALIQIMVTDERLKWYLAGLLDGYAIHGKRYP